MIQDTAGKAELLNLLEEKDRQLNELKKELLESEKLDFAWTGNLGHWYWDVISNTVSFNPLKVSALGYSTDEIPENIGFEFFTEKIHPDDYEPVMQNMRDHLYGKSPVYEVEYRIKARNGEYKYFYDRGSITRRTSEGKPEFLAGIVFDITDKKRHEKRQEDLIQFLSTQMELKEKISSIIFHDIKSPLATIYGFSNMLQSVRQSSLPEDVRSQLKSIEDLSMKTMETIDYISSWLRSGITSRLTPADVNGEKLIEDALNEMREDLNLKDLKVETRIDDVTHRSSKEILSIALRNLLMNAIKFTPRGGRIRIIWNEKGLSVQDSGIGMSPEQLERMFTSRHQSTYGTEKEIGHGLGLLIVKDLLNKVHADLQYESVLNKGTTACIILE